MKFSRLVPWILGSYIVFMFGVAIAGVGNLSYYGDELIHLSKLTTFLEHGLYTVRVGTDDSGQLVSTFGHVYVYGPLFTLIGHLVAVLFGAETWGTVAYTDAAFAIRHYVVAAFSFITVVAVGWGVWLVTRSRTWGLSASSLLVSIPMWTGSAIFNVKDIPLSSGFTLLTVGCIALSLPRERLTRATTIGGWVVLYLGTLLIWGVRPGFWTAIVLCGVAMLLIQSRLNNFRDWTVTFRTLIAPATAVLASYATMVIIYPAIFLNPVWLAIKSVSELATFGHEDIILTDGEYLHMPPPWYYIPKWLAAQLPELIVVLLVAAMGTAVWLVVRRVFQSSPHRLDFALPAVVFVFVQLAAYPVSAILLRSRITSGYRQFLFTVPAMSMLITLIAFLAVTYLTGRVSVWLWRTVGVLAIASTALTTVIQVQLSPYMSSYFNPSTFSRGVTGNWEIYAQKLSPGELWSKLTVDERNRCKRLCPPADTFPSKFATPTEAADTRLAYWEVVNFPKSRTSLDGNQDCNFTLATVERPYLWGTFVVTRASACTLSSRTFSPAPHDSTDLVKWWKGLAKWGWESPSESGLVAQPGVRSALAWTVEPYPPVATQTFVVTLSVGTGSSDSVIVRTTVNGTSRADITLVPGSPVELTISITASSFGDGPDGLVVVEFDLVDAGGNPVTNVVTITGLDRGN